MGLIELILIGIGLAMDCLAVSLTSGICLKKINFKTAAKIGLFFGFFQGGMPLLGWLLGTSFRGMIEQIDHWIAFSILLIIGIKMIVEGLKSDPTQKRFNINNIRLLLGLSIATSIDALIVGLGFAFLNVNILKAGIIICIITFIISIIGVFIGKRSGKYLGNKAEIFGGLVLIGIGVKILLEHILV